MICIVFSLKIQFLFNNAEPHSSFGSLQDLKTGGRRFDPRGRLIYFGRGLVIVIAIGFIPLSSLSIVWTLVESSQWLGGILLGALIKRTPEYLARCTGRCDITEILWTTTYD